MKKYELDAEQQVMLEKSFMAITNRDGWLQKFETINEKMSQLARSFMLLTPKSAEQTMAIRKLQEAQYWFEQAIKKNEM